MSGRGKKPYRSQSSKAGLVLPVGRLKRYLKNNDYSDRVGKGAPIYLAAVLEYLCAEILELAGNVTKDLKKKTMNVRHILLAIRNDEELNKLCKKVTIANGGVYPHIPKGLFPDKNKNP